MSGKRIILALAVVVGTLSSATLAGPARPQYRSERVSMGPRPDQYVLVRVDRQDRQRPYALLGTRKPSVERRLVQRWVGPRYIGPVWVSEARAE